MWVYHSAGNGGSRGNHVDEFPFLFQRLTMLRGFVGWLSTYRACEPVALCSYFNDLQSTRSQIAARLIPK